jgi:hypothetical protein
LAFMGEACGLGGERRLDGAVRVWLSLVAGLGGRREHEAAASRLLRPWESLRGVVAPCGAGEDSLRSRSSSSHVCPGPRTERLEPGQLNKVGVAQAESKPQPSGMLSVHVARGPRPACRLPGSRKRTRFRYIHIDLDRQAPTPTSTKRATGRGMKASADQALRVARPY